MGKMRSRDHKRFHGIILDMDGVLWRGNSPIGNLPEIFRRLRELGWQITLATNNSTNTAEQYQDKLRQLGVQVDSSQIVTSSQATARYLKQHNPDGGEVFVIGSINLSRQITDQGFSLLGVDDKANSIKAVVVGLDRDITFPKLRYASYLIRSGAPFIATNPDCTFPTPQGLEPGTGTIVAAVQAASSVKPFYIGKPEPEMYRYALEIMGLKPSEVLVVGDRLETDILGAQNLGNATALVLSGVTTPDDAQKWRPKPDYIASDLTALIDHFQTA